MTIMPEPARTEVLKRLGPTGFTPPPQLTAALDQMLTESAERDDPLEDHVERAIFNFLQIATETDAGTVAINAGCMIGDLLYRLIKELRDNQKGTTDGPQ